MIEAAQHAAAAGDYAAAERLLREAADRQEATLGSSHPDLATTLNNLAFVCERNGRIDEAERGYRRAHAIAVASLSPGHPFIKTSLSNLVEFCAVQGIPIWTKPETPLEDEPLPDDDVDIDADVDVDLESSEIVAASLPAADVAASARRLPVRMMAVAAIAGAAIVVMVFARQGQGRSDTAQPVATPRTESAAPPAAVVPKTAMPAAAGALDPTVRPERVEPTPDDLASVTVLNAQLCRALERTGSPDWQCTPATDEGPPGTFTFYTRLLTTTATIVEHRWYRNDRVHQSMRLRVSASPGAGYRTFSVTTVSPERAGEWKVELRAADGSVLHETRFFVR
jgi:hypothetical protein